MSYEKKIIVNLILTGSSGNNYCQSLDIFQMLKHCGFNDLSYALETRFDYNFLGEDTVKKSQLWYNNYLIDDNLFVSVSVDSNTKLHINLIISPHKIKRIINGVSQELIFEELPNFIKHIENIDPKLREIYSHKIMAHKFGMFDTV